MNFIRVIQRTLVLVALYFGLYLLLMDRKVLAVDERGDPRFSCASRFFGGGMPLVVNGTTHGLRRVTFLNYFFLPAGKIDQFIFGGNGPWWKVLLW